MNVAAVIVTRGDVDLTPLLATIPDGWETVVWNNATAEEDVAVYGRYAALDRTGAELIYVQDDDCVVSDPQAIVAEWYASGVARSSKARHAGDYDATTVAHSDHVVCNMPPEFRHDFYEEHALVGFGAVFHREAAARAFDSFWGTYPVDAVGLDLFHRTCDIVFTHLTPRVLVDVPKEDLPHAHHETRMWKSPGHQADRVRMLDLVRAIA